MESELTVVVSTLLEAAADKDEGVREAVITSLRKLAKRHPRCVLENAVTFRKRNPKLTASHLMTLLQTMVQICQQKHSDFDADTLTLLIEFSVDEMTNNRDYLPDLQMPASDILVALGQTHCNQVMEGLLKHFQPGILPHYTILHTMGALASANVFGIIPFIKATLGAMLPMMGMLRNDAMKQVFACTLGKFSDAVLEYLANIDQAPDSTVNKEAYESEISISYDVLVSSWLSTREPKVCETVLQAIGPMFSLLSSSKVAEQVPRLVPTLLGLYRRGVDPYPVTQCLATVLLVAIEVNKNTLDQQMDNLLSTMFELVCTSPDYAQPLTVKNHYEVLRCFDRIAGHFSDKVVDLLIQQLKCHNERERLKALFVAAHLVNSSDSCIRSRVPDLVATLRQMLADHSVKVNKVMLKVIVALAHRGYLADGEGKKFVEFIVRHCCPSATTAVGRDGDQSEDLHETSANTLYLLATTVPQFESTLWPLLLTLLVTSQYTPACATIAWSLAHLASRRRDEDTFVENESTKMTAPELEHIPYSSNIPGSSSMSNVPSPNVVFGRCLALLGSPLRSNLGIHVLTFLKNYVQYVSRLLKPLWEQTIPELIQHLKECSSSAWSDRVWDDLVLDFVSASLREVGEEKWTLGFGTKLMEQVPLYTAYPCERGMLFKCLAVTVCHTADKQFINQSTDVILGTTRQHTALESKACARALGICARRHLEFVQLKLAHLMKDELSRKSSKMLGFMKDVKQESEMERTRLTLLLAYGQVALEAPGVDLLPQVEVNMVNWVVQQLQVAKDLPIREAALNTLGNIAEALHPNRNSLRFELQSRMQILTLVLNQLHQGQMFPTILQVATKLIKLSPCLTSDERIGVVRTCFERVFELVTATNATDEQAAEIRRLNNVDNILDSLRTLTRELLLGSVTPATLDDIFTLLEPWFSADSWQQRLASVETLETLLETYLDNVTFGFENPSKFSQCGLIVGCIVPRCTDGHMAVRKCAIGCVHLSLCIAARYEGHTTDYDIELAKDLEKIKQRIQTDDPGMLFKATSDLAKIICGKLPHGQVLQFTDSLLDGLLDSQSSSSSGSSVLLNVFLKVKGGELYHHVNDIVSSILHRMGNILCSQTRTGSVRAVLALAHHHPKAVVTTLLRQPIPYDSCVSECWMMLAQDPGLSGDIIEQFLQVVSAGPLYEDQKDKEKLRIAVLLPLSAISALNEMFRIASVQDIAIQRFPELFSMLLIALGCYIGTSPPIYTPQQVGNKHSFVPNRNAYKLNPARVALEAFKSFLLCAKCEVGAEALLHCSHMEVGESLASFVEMVPHLTKAVCLCMPQSLPKLVVCLNQYGTSIYDPQRITVSAFYAELVYLKSNQEMVLLESIVSNLLNCLTDPSPVVRRLCLKGLAAVSRLEPKQRNRHVEPVLTALIDGLDDQDLTSSDSVPLEAMRGFSQMVCVIDEEQVRDVQVSVALRIKPYFEKENVNIRAAAFQVFGDLAKFGGLTSKAAFQEQVNNNLLCLLLHLDDSEKSVVKACKYALRQVSPLLDADRLNTMMQAHLIDDANLQYSDFMADIVKIMVEELPDLVPLLIMHSLSYIKSLWPNIRGNAAMFIGLLCSNFTVDPENHVPIETVCARLIQLLKDQDQGVRAKAAEAMSCLFVNTES